MTAAELAYMAGQVQLSMDTACQILHKSSSSDGMGGQTDSWGTPTNTVCRISPYKRPDEEREIEQRLGLDQRWTIALPAGTAISPKDRILANGITYEVDTVSGPRSREISRAVLAYQVQ